MAASNSKHKRVNLSKVATYSISKRKNKTQIKMFGRPFDGNGARDFLDSLPQFLKASDLKRFINLAHHSRKNNKPFHWMLGAHTIKVGLSPVIIDLMEQKIVTGLSFNGAGLIHDLELAFWGGTSEDVQAGLKDGTFGMVKETAEHYAEVTVLAESENLGLGEACGKYITMTKAKHRKLSLFGACYELGLPITVHIGVGTDIIAQHSQFNAAAAARASHLDFRVLAEICKSLDRGGCLANLGSAVMLPEVFLKALTVARNLQSGKSRLTTANFDMISHYRPTENVVNRPTLGAGLGFNFVGHHEIMVPLLAWSLKAEFGR